MAVVQIYADGFSSLSLREKQLIWHLYLAALAGRDIYYDQRYAHNLELRAVLEGILTHAPTLPPDVERRDPALHEAVLDQQRSLQRRHRAQEPAADRPGCVDRAPWKPRPPAVRRCRSGPANRRAIWRSGWRPILFDAAFDPVLTNKSPGPGRDILRASANNLYVGVSMDDLASFDERHGLNSRLVNARRPARRRGVSRRRHDTTARSAASSAISRTPSPLRRRPPPTRCARSSASTPPAKRPTAWPTTSPGCAIRPGPVDTINGFIEVYLDPRGHQGRLGRHGVLRQSRAHAAHRGAGGARPVVRGPRPVAPTPSASPKCSASPPRPSRC